MQKELEIGTTTIIAAVLAIIIGVGLGYLSYPAFNPKVADAVDSQQITCSADGTFAFDSAKAATIQKMFEDIFYLQSGAKHTLAYVNHTDRGAFVQIDYLIDDQFEQSVYITKDYQYVMQEPAKVTDIQKEITSAMTELEAENQPAEKTDKPSVKLYVMSYCPYGNLAENGFVEVVKLLGDKIDFEPVYILSGSNGNYQSLHGEKELNQDIREKIIYNKYGAVKWIEYVYDTNKNCTLNTIDTCWKEAAERQGISVADVEAEYAANFNAIADGEVAKTDSAGVSASPTILMGGQKYSGTPFVAESYKQWICEAFSTAPEECGQTLSTSSGTTASGSC